MRVAAGRGAGVATAAAMVSAAPPRRRKRGRAGLVVRIVLAVIVGIVMVFPFWVMVVTAFSGQSVFTGQVDLWPDRVSVDNFTRVFRAWPVPLWFGNSVTVSLITTFLTVLISVLAGFAFAKLRFPGRNVLFLVLLSTMMIPTQAILVSQFRIVDNLGLLGTFWAVIIPGAAATFGIFLARQFMLAIPNELIEAARIDGAGTGRIFLSVVLPLSKPLLAVLTPLI